MEKKPIKFSSIFEHFCGTYEAAVLLMIKPYLDISDFIGANEHTKYANWGLNVNLEFFVNAILFYDRKGSF